MQKPNRFITNTIVLLSAICLLSVEAYAESQIPDRDIQQFTILQTSDIHNHASGYGPFFGLYTPHSR